MNKLLIVSLVVSALAIVGCREDEHLQPEGDMGGTDLAVPTEQDLAVVDLTEPSAMDDGGMHKPDLKDLAPLTPPNDAGDPQITPGASNHFLLIGTILTPDEVIIGQVLVEDSLITCVAPGTQCASMPNASDATIIDTHGVIAPGLIDTHNHILFDIFNDDDWLPSKVYQDHNQWTSEPRYQAMLDVKQCLVDDSQGKPTWCANTPYGTSAGSLRCEADKFGELKALVAGTTSVVGLPGTSAACFGSLTRSIDVAQNGLSADKIQTSATFPPSASSANGVCKNVAAMTTDAYLIHVGEGLATSSANTEFAKLASVTTPTGCLLEPSTTITHGVAFGANEFQMMANAGVKLTWSPASNVALYQATADIPTARMLGVTVALAPDWSMGGSQNLLDELRFADQWDNDHWSDTLSAQDLVDMVTKNAAEVVARPTQLGKIAVGFLADIAVFRGDLAQPYETIVAATPKQVELVMIGGVPLYGDAGLVSAGPSLPGCEMIDMCGAQKFLCVAQTLTTNKFNQTYADITSALNTALTAADAQTPADGWDFAPLPPLFKCP